MELADVKYKTIVKNIRTQLSLYLNVNKRKTMVIGVSGGLDSTVVAALASLVTNAIDKPLYGLSLPSTSNMDNEVSRASKTMNAFCTPWIEYAIDPEVELLSSALGMTGSPVTNRSCQSNSHAFRIGNLKARLRMIMLYDAAQCSEGLVLSTDNKTEYLLGFWTLHGDVGDIGIIQNLWKTEIFELAEYMANSTDLGFNDEQKDNLLAAIYAVPTDGLGISDSDLDQILPNFKENEMSHRKGYELVDQRLKEIIHETGSSTINNDPILNRYYNSMFKRNNPFNFTRKDLLEI